MPKSAAAKRKLVLNRETVRALDAKGAGRGFITTKGPSEVYTYCMMDCATETEYCTVSNYC